MKILLILFTLFALAGCATLSREECLQADWSGLGFKDGLAGEPSSRISRHQEACTDYGVTIDHQQYLTGRMQGLVDYCRLENAFNSGLNGHAYQNVCPPPIDALFRRYHAAAYAVYNHKKDLEKIDDQLSSHEDQLLDKKLSDADRKRIRNEIRDLDRQRERLRADLYDHQRALDMLRYEASAYR